MMPQGGYFVLCGVGIDAHPLNYMDLLNPRSGMLPYVMPSSILA